MTVKALKNGLTIWEVSSRNLDNFGEIVKSITGLVDELQKSPSFNDGFRRQIDRLGIDDVFKVIQFEMFMTCETVDNKGLGHYDERFIKLKR